ncbi:MAG: apolipoprotein N-acyltransferase [Candidatus Omnitrophica bacterium]|nr:apolipoprotein N-acyltransferase [Candidatus Omnitrophota bacterium]
MLRKIKDFSWWKDYLLCLFSAVFLALSFLSFKLWFFSWFGFVPLFFALKDKSKLKAFILAYLTGFIFWLGTIYWLVYVTLIGTVLLSLYLALYFSIFGLFVKHHLSEATYYELLFIPSVWVLLEYIRSYLFTGFPWAFLAYSQYRNLAVIQIADITGSWGVSFLIVLVNLTIYFFLSKKPRYIFCLFCLFIVLIYGLFRLYRIQTVEYKPQNKGIRVAVIQGNIPQELKWDSQQKDFILNRYLSLTSQVAREKPDLIIWPEAALPVVLEEEPIYFKRIDDLVKNINIPILLGAVTLRNNLYYNSAILVYKNNKDIAQYNKLHLVPFGEYVPLKKILAFLETVVPIGDFSPGKEYTLFKLPFNNLESNFSVLICFEDLFSELARKFVKKGAQFLVNITNDAWYKKTPAPFQHLSASVFRAIENRVFLVRSANTGISGFIGPDGRIISLVKDKLGREIFVTGYTTERIFVNQKGLSFYTRYGDIFVGLCLLFILKRMVSSIFSGKKAA